MSKVIDFTGKTVVITGAGGVICGHLSKEFAKAGAKVALLDLNLDAAQSFVEEILSAGGIAKAYKTNVLSKENLEQVRKMILKDFGIVDILINGAGGNNPKATTDNEFHEQNLPPETKSFFDLDEAGINFVFNLNYLGTLLPTQVFAKDMVRRKGTYAVDRDAAIRSMDAALRAGVRRYVMVSYFGAGPDHGIPEDDPFHAYAQAKAAADAHLRSSGLDWTILGPATLTFEKRTRTGTAAASIRTSISTASPVRRSA